RVLIREVCIMMVFEMINGHVSRDHVLLLLSVPPYISASDVMKRVKGKTSRKLLSESRMLSKKFWGRHLWARGYFAATSGNVTDEVIMQYIELQAVQEQERDDDITIE
ncbi:MAG: IS200/IS605 family transposase, partial [Candidatus Bathyarchaeota archaeon]